MTKIGFEHRYYEKYRSEIRAVADGRFTAQSKEALALLKKLTHYDKFERRDGGIVSCALLDGRLVEGEEMEQLIIEDFRNIHCLVKGFEADEVRFPELLLTEEQVKCIIVAVNKGKGLVLDGVTDERFKLRDDFECKKRAKEGNDELCDRCKRKVQFAKSLLGHAYWKTEEAKKHLRSRLICLNKVYPRIPQVNEYRPITVMSPVIKLLQGLITPTLAAWMKSRMHKSQYGFKEKRGIEDCRANLFQELMVARAEKVKCLFSSWTSKVPTIGSTGGFWRGISGGMYYRDGRWSC